MDHFAVFLITTIFCLMLRNQRLNTTDQPSCIMQTSQWGPPSWTSLFYIAAGYDLNELPKRIKDPKYKQYFKSVGHVLPCRYCRESYDKFYDSMDIQRYLNMPSCGLIKFVYDLKNMVNAKLKAQEDKALQDEYDLLLQTMSPQDPRFTQRMEEAKKRICYTKSPPPFEQVVHDLMKHRASCSAAMKTCRDPLSASSYPATAPMPMLATNQMTDAAVYRKGGAPSKRKRSSRSTTRRRNRNRSSNGRLKRRVYR